MKKRLYVVCQVYVWPSTAKEYNIPYDFVYAHSQRDVTLWAQRNVKRMRRAIRVDVAPCGLLNRLMRWIIGGPKIVELD